MNLTFHRNIIKDIVSKCMLVTKGKRTYRSISKTVFSTHSLSRYQMSISDRSRSRSRIMPMSRVSVKNFDNDERIHIMVDLSIKDGTVKSFNMNRLKTEEHGVALERLRLNFSKKMVKKKKKKANECAAESTSTTTTTSDDISLNILKDGHIILPSIENEKAWVEGSLLQYNEEEITIACNVPSVKLIKFPTIVMAGCPLFPLADFEFCDVDSCDFYWKVIDKNDVHACNLNISKGKMLDLKDALCTTSFSPNVSDIGKHILLVCVPKNNEKEGRPDAILSEVSIEPGPSDVCPFEKRHEFTKTRSKNGEFRVVSYNLLADIYSNTEFAQNSIFPYCPKNALDMNYRKHLLLKEILGYQADLMCFQEVDKSIFESHLTPALKSLNFEGMLRVKSKKSSEGSAMFIRTDKFRIISQLDIVLSEFLMQDPSCQDIWKKVEKIEALREKIEERSSVLQVTVVESVENPGSYLCLANTHLYFHPDACNVRLIHAATAMRHLQNICNSYEQEGKTVAIVFCGDFNSAPHLGVYQLLTAQFVPAEHVDFQSGGEMESVEDLELSHSLHIESACGTPAYTNFTRGFISTLDYIFMDASKLKVTSVVPMPDHADVTANVALPSIVFPSDHIALVCDMTFSS